MAIGFNLSGVDEKAATASTDIPLSTPTEMTLTEFMDSRYRDYALYVLYSRAIPSLIDGLKPSQRKVLWTADKVATSKMKTSALAGAVTEKANYHHGSTDGVASLMAGTHCNNAPLLDAAQGNFGSRMVPAYSAPRYTFVKISPNFAKYFCDNEILPPSPDPEDPEPKYYLPLIPWVLVNGVEGIAIGYATEIQPRDPKLLAKVCFDYVSGKKTREQVLAMDIPPFFNDFNGTVFKREGSWACRGTWTRKGTRKVEVTELPIGTVRLKYIEFLNKEKEKGRYINGYEEGKTDGRFSVVVKFTAEADLENADWVTKFLRLERALSENITTIDEKNRLRIFESSNELLLYFCDFRLTRYSERFDAWTKRDSDKVEKLQAKKLFIQMVVARHIEFSGKTKAVLKEVIQTNFLAKGIKLTPDLITMLLDVRTYEFCEDEIQEISDKTHQLESDIVRWNEAVPKEWYSKELKELTK